MKGIKKEPIEIHYRFGFQDGTMKEFDVTLDGDTLALQIPVKPSYPHWTALTCNQCPNCPLKEAEYPQCPIAVSLLDVFEFFKDFKSSETADVEIETESRTYFKQTPISNGISSLIGLHMATAGCPLFDKLKPMVLTHLPFASLRESTYRFLSMYMLAQHFQARRGRQPDMEMKGFVAMLSELRTANRAFCKRLYEVCRKDASLNAVVHLDCFADNTAFSLKTMGLEEVERTFHAHFTDLGG